MATIGRFIKKVKKHKNLVLVCGKNNPALTMVMRGLSFLKTVQMKVSKANSYCIINERLYSTFYLLYSIFLTHSLIALTTVSTNPNLLDKSCNIL